MEDIYRIKDPMVGIVTNQKNFERTMTCYSQQILGPMMPNQHIKTIVIENNTESLSVRYNELLEEAKNEGHDALILVHDDVLLEHTPIPKLESLFWSYDLVGVAGASRLDIKSPALWHLMGQGHLHGAVAHGDFPRQMTSFGPYPARVLMIDGVFMAMNRNIIENVRFDESNPAKFHFYDLDFSLTCHKNGYRVGVGDIYISHMSPGLREFTDEWKNGEKWFLDKHTTK